MHEKGAEEFGSRVALKGVREYIGIDNDSILG